MHGRHGGAWRAWDSATVATCMRRMLRHEMTRRVPLGMHGVGGGRVGVPHADWLQPAVQVQGCSGQARPSMAIACLASMQRALHASYDQQAADHLEHDRHLRHKGAGRPKALRTAQHAARSTAQLLCCTLCIACYRRASTQRRAQRRACGARPHGEQCGTARARLASNAQYRQPQAAAATAGPSKAR